MSNGRIDQVYDIPAIQAQFKTVFGLMDEMARKIEQLNSAAAGINLGGSRGANRAGQMQQTVAAADQLEKVMQRLAQAESAAGQAIANESEKLRQQNLLNRQAARENQANATSLDGMRAALARATRAYDAMSAAQRNNRNEGVKQLASIRALQNQIRTLEQETGRFQRNVGNYPNRLVGGLTGFLGGAGLGVAAGAAGVGLAAKAIFDTTLQLDSLNIALRNVSGSEEEFAKNQLFLVETTERLGLNILGTTDAFKGFFASATQAGLSAAQTRDVFESVSEAGATLKLSNDQINGAFLALGQTISKGKVQAEELRGQLAERIPGAFSIAARAIGVTEAQLNKMLERGEVIASDFLPKFAAELRKTYGADGPVEGLQASINRLSNEFTDLVSNNQSGLSRFFAGIINFFRGALNGFNSFLERVQNADYGKFFGRLGAQIGGDVTQADITRDGTFSASEVDRKRREMLIAGNNSYIDAFKKATERERQEILKRARILAEATAKAAAENPAGGLLSGGSFMDIAQSAKQRAAASRAQDAAFQEADKVRRYEQIIAEERANNVQKVGNLTKEQITTENRMRQLALQSTLKLYQLDQDEAIASQKAIAENEKLSIGERLVALANYNALRTASAEKQAEFDKKIIEENIKLNKAVPDQLKVVDKELAAQRRAIAEDTGKIQVQIVKQNVDARIKAILSESEREAAALGEAQSAELEQLQDLYNRKALTTEQFELAEFQVHNKYAILQLQAEIELTKKILAVREARGEDVSAEQKKILDAEQQLRDLDFQAFEKLEKDKTKVNKKETDLRKQQEEELRDKIVEIGNELLGFFFAVNNARFEEEKNRLADETEAIKKRKNEEIEAVNATTLSAQEKADRIAVINARAQAEEERIEARKRQIQIEQARFERAQAIAGIILNTSLAVVKTLATGGPLAIPLAVAVGALGAVQLATALATPLPRYAGGREGGPAEWALVNDGGRDEVIARKDGTAYVPQGCNVITYLGQGDTVYRSVDDYVNSVAAGANRRAPAMSVNSAGQLQIKQDLERQTREMVAAMARNKATMVVKNTWAGVQVSQENAAGFFRYIHKNVFK